MQADVAVEELHPSQELSGSNGGNNGGSNGGSNGCSNGGSIGGSSGGINGGSRRSCISGLVDHAILVGVDGGSIASTSALH